MDTPSSPIPAPAPTPSPSLSPPPALATENTVGPETEPLIGPQPSKKGKHHASPLTNGAPRRHKHATPLFPSPYLKCNKNYSASTGGHVLDGCGEFMPSTTPLYCDACGCHRSFHRQSEHNYCLNHQQNSPPSSPSPSPISSSYFPRVYFDANRNGKKRNRTKFSEEQSEKMKEFAERVGWKISKKDDQEMIMGFCDEVGVTKRVLKVWMHNHKDKSVNINNHPEKGANSPSTSELN